MDCSSTQEVLALRWGPRSTCSVSFKEPRPWRGRSSVQCWGSDVWLGWSCRLWRSVTNHLMAFKTESHLKFMCYRCKNTLVKGWSVTNATRTATQTEVTELVMLIFWNLNINLNLLILVILIWFDIDTGGHTCDADCGPDDHHPAGDRDLIYMWQ